MRKARSQQSLNNAINSDAKNLRSVPLFGSGYGKRSPALRPR